MSCDIERFCRATISMKRAVNSFKASANKLESQKDFRKNMAISKKKKSVNFWKMCKILEKINSRKYIYIKSKKNILIFGKYMSRNFRNIYMLKR